MEIVEWILRKFFFDFLSFPIHHHCHRPPAESKAHKLHSERAEVKVESFPLHPHNFIYSYSHLGCFTYNLKLRLMLKVKVLVCHKAECCGVKLSGKRLRISRRIFFYIFIRFSLTLLTRRPPTRSRSRLAYDIFWIWFWLSSSSERAGCFHIDVINLRDIMSNSIFYASITLYAAS